MKLNIPDVKEFLNRLNDEAFADPLCGYYPDRAVALLLEYEDKEPMQGCKL